MSNKQARASKKLVLKRIVLTFEDGTATYLDPLKVDIVDVKTREPIFKRKES